MLIAYNLFQLRLFDTYSERGEEILVSVSGWASRKISSCEGDIINLRRHFFISSLIAHLIISSFIPQSSLQLSLSMESWLWTLFSNIHSFFQFLSRDYFCVRDSAHSLENHKRWGKRINQCDVWICEWWIHILKSGKKSRTIEATSLHQTIEDH